ncbi:VWA domain-containing protein [Streptomyces sp. BSE7-9]|nr:VWA domain-containing protein [Streptomyces sp. BSE7-9]
MTACTAGSTPHGEFARDKQILASCDRSAPPASDIQIDGTGSSNSPAITEERMAAVEQIVRTTAICSGRVRMSVFSGSSAATATLFDGALPLHGATDNARLKRVQTVVDDAMVRIRDAYEPAVAGLKGKGSDITAQYRLAGEWANQVGGEFRLHLYLFTDGFQNVGVKLGQQAVSKQEAAELASKTNVPKLPGASVTVAGLGRVAGEPPRSDVVEGLVVYYDALCDKAGAAKCVSVTDYAPEGR